MEGTHLGTPRPGATSRAHVWGIPALLAIAMLANAAMVPLVPFTLATRLCWPLWVVGGYSFAVMAVTMLVNHRMSGIVDRAERKSLLCLLCASFQVVGALAAIGAVNGLLWLLPLTVIGTALGGAVAPVYYTLGRIIASATGRSSSTVNSLLRVVTSGAWVAGPAIGFAVAGTQGIAVAFAMIAGIAVVGALAVLTASRWLDSAALQSAAGARSAADDGPSGLRQLLPHIGAFTVVFLFSLAHIATATSLPLFLSLRFDIPEPVTGLFLGLKAGVEMLVILLSPMLAKRLDSRNILTMAALGALITYSSYLLGNGVGWALFASVCEGAYYGLFAVTALTWVQSLAGMRLGQSTGLYMNGIYGGVLIGAPLSGLVASVDLEWIAGLSMLAALLALGALRLRVNAPADRSSLQVAEDPR